MFPHNVSQKKMSTLDVDLFFLHHVIQLLLPNMCHSVTDVTLMGEKQSQ